MKILRTAILATGLAVMSIGAALAAPPIGSGGGYYGGAWYDSNQGSVVGPYSTYYACNQALQNALDNAVNNFGWTITSLTPCSYRPPYGTVLPGYEVEIWADGAGQSGDVATGVLFEATKLREAHRVDDYDRAIRDFVNANHKDQPCDSGK